jgi:hypothetical protein
MLEIVVGSGGMAGVSGTETTSIDIDAQRAIMKERFKAETFLSREERIARKAGDSNVIESDCGVSPGGLPGGGEGYGGGGYWACGGGGGYTIVSKRTPKGNQAMIVAAGGGGECPLSLSLSIIISICVSHTNSILSLVNTTLLLSLQPFFIS